MEASMGLQMAEVMVVQMAEAMVLQTELQMALLMALRELELLSVLMLEPHLVRLLVMVVSARKYKYHLHLLPQLRTGPCYR